MKILFALCCSVLLCRGQIIENLVGGDEHTASNAGTYGFGFFTGSEPLTILALGVYCSSRLGLLDQHRIGIWDSSGSHIPIGQTTVDCSSAITNGFACADLSCPITLRTNAYYVLGAYYAAESPDRLLDNVESLHLTGATFGYAMLSAAGAFDRPRFEASILDEGSFGPNAIALQIPEPAPSGVLIGALLCVFLVLRNRKN